MSYAHFASHIHASARISEFVFKGLTLEQEGKFGNRSGLLNEMSKLKMQNDNYKITPNEAVECTDSLSDDIPIPETYREAMNSIEHAIKWKNECNEDLDSNNGLYIYELVETPEEGKQISTRWIFREKGNEKG